MALAGSAVLYQAGPSVLAIGSLRRRLLPGVCGVAPGPHVALTFDDGPDPASTPAFLDELGRLEVHATFFLLGSQLITRPQLGRRIVQAGHEVAVHGWTHRAHLLRRPRDVAADLRRARDAVSEQAGSVPQFWRPPYGIPTAAGLRAARRLVLRPVLWTSDGRDWQAGATAASVTERVRSTLRPGGVILLHDSDVTSAPFAWRASLAALPGIVGVCRSAGWPLGPLAEHGLC